MALWPVLGSTLELLDMGRAAAERKILSTDRVHLLKPRPWHGRLWEELEAL